ncbi:MAG: hypothetical protein V4525_13260 [Pseudomonadota bacterium]
MSGKKPLCVYTPIVHRAIIGSDAGGYAIITLICEIIENIVVADIIFITTNIFNINLLFSILK